jgi:hypothetical protein
VPRCRAGGWSWLAQSALKGLGAAARAAATVADDLDTLHASAPKQEEQGTVATGAVAATGAVVVTTAVDTTGMNPAPGMKTALDTMIDVMTGAMTACLSAGAGTITGGRGALVAIGVHLPTTEQVG